MYLDKDDNDNEQKNIDTYKILGDQMARLELKYDNKEKEDETNYLITYNDLVGKTSNANPSLKLGTPMETKSKGKVKFSQGIKASPNPTISKNDTKKSFSKNKSNKSFSKQRTDNSMNESDKKMLILNTSNNNIETQSFKTQTPINMNNVSNNITINPSFKNSNGNIIVNPNNDDSISHTNSNELNKNNISSKKLNTSIKNNNITITKGSQANILSSIPKPKPKKKNSIINIPSSIIFNKNNNIVSNINSNNSNQNNNNNNNNNQDSKNNDSINTDDLEPIEIEILNPEEIEEESSNVNPFNCGEKIISKGHKTLYEREMRNLSKKETKLKKERNLKYERIMSHLQDGPDINEKSHKILEHLGQYVPIQERAAQIYNRHLTRIMMNEELKKMEKKQMEEKEWEEIKTSRMKRRKYEKEKWDTFVENCFKWKEEVNYKRKAAEMFRDKKVNYKPKISSRSKQIMKKNQRGNNSVDDVFTRLYNDYEAHKDRQKILDENILPSFTPQINNFNHFRNVNKRRSNVNNSFDQFITNNRKNNFFLESHYKANKGKIYPYNKNKVTKNNKIKKACKFVNKPNEKRTINNKKNEIWNKSYKPTQATNNSTIGLNTEGTTIPMTNRFITTENPLMTETNQYFMPSIGNNNFFSDEKLNEIFDTCSTIQNNNSKKINPKKNNDYFEEIKGEESMDYNNYSFKRTNEENNTNNNNDTNNINSNTSRGVKDKNKINYRNNNRNKFANNKYESNTYSNNIKYNDKCTNNSIDKYMNNSKNNNYTINDNFNNRNEYIDSQDSNPNYIYDNNNTKKSKNLKKGGRNKKNESKNKNKKGNTCSKSVDKNKSYELNEKNFNCCIGTEEMFRDEQILQELNDAKKTHDENDNETEDDIEKKQESLYQLNIRDTTPDKIRENVIVPSNKYNDFFNVESLEEL